jgi:hypothetical protein
VGTTKAAFPVDRSHISFVICFVERKKRQNPAPVKYWEIIVAKSLKPDSAWMGLHASTIWATVWTVDAHRDGSELTLSHDGATTDPVAQALTGVWPFIHV